MNLRLASFLLFTSFLVSTLSAEAAGIKNCSALFSKLPEQKKVAFTYRMGGRQRRFTAELYPERELRLSIPSEGRLLHYGQSSYFRPIPYRSMDNLITLLMIHRDPQAPFTLESLGRNEKIVHDNGCSSCSGEVVSNSKKGDLIEHPMTRIIEGDDNYSVTLERWIYFRYKVTATRENASYYDTPNRAGEKAGIAIRLKRWHDPQDARTRKPRFQTFFLKVDLGVVDGYHLRREWRVPLRETPNLRQIRAMSKAILEYEGISLDTNRLVESRIVECHRNSLKIVHRKTPRSRQTQVGFVTFDTFSVQPAKGRPSKTFHQLEFEFFSNTSVDRILDENSQEFAEFMRHHFEENIEGAENTSHIPKVSSVR